MVEDAVWLCAEWTAAAGSGKEEEEEEERG